MKPAPSGPQLVTKHHTLTRLEQDLRKVPGITAARVVGNEEPTEIHIVADLRRHPKQIVRDVQSLASAGFGIPVDHRIVSIVQLEEDASRSEEQGSTSRPNIELVLTGSEGTDGWAKVYLGWPNGGRTEGQAPVGTSRELRARGATDALIAALEPVLKERKSRLEVEHVVVQSIGIEESVVVRATLYEPEGTTALIGSALVQEEVVGAAVRALLQAINRKLR